jgi:hypothetical protein
MTLLLRGITDAETGQFCLVKTKKDLKQCIGDYLCFDDPSIFGQAKHPLQGDAIVIDPKTRNKFAQVWTNNEGKITKVT